MVGMYYDLVNRTLLSNVKRGSVDSMAPFRICWCPLVCRSVVQWVILLDNTITEHLVARQFEWWNPDSSYTSFILGSLNYSWSCMPIIASSWAWGNDNFDTLLGHKFCSHYSRDMSPIVLEILYLRMHRGVKRCHINDIRLSSLF